MNADTILGKIHQSQMKKVIVFWNPDPNSKNEVTGESWYIGMTNNEFESDKSKFRANHREVFKVESFTDAFKICKDLFIHFGGDVNSIPTTNFLKKNDDIFIEIYIKYHVN